MNITVYLGSSYGNDPAYAENCRALGKWIGENGHTLVYGGSDSGLMGILADAVLAEKGNIIGVMPEFLVRRNRGYDLLENLMVTSTMSERREKMMAAGDVYIAMPGGPGTLEEISEAVSAGRLGLHHKPCIFFNINGYYDAAEEFFEQMTRCGFASADELRHVYFVRTLNELAGILEKHYEI